MSEAVQRSPNLTLAKLLPAQLVNKNNKDKIDNIFTVYLIPETLRITTMLDKKIGDMINLEVETQTKNTVDLITEMKVKK